MADIQEEQFAAAGARFRSLWGRRCSCDARTCSASQQVCTCAHPDVGGLAGRIRESSRVQINPGRCRIGTLRVEY